MKENRREKLIMALGQTLPPITQSATDLITYIQQEDKKDKMLLKKVISVLENMRSGFSPLKEIYASILDENVFTSDEAEFEVELLKKYFDGIFLLQKGCRMLIVLIDAQFETPEQQSARVLFDINPESITVESAVDNLYQGSKVIVEVLDGLFES